MAKARKHLKVILDSSVWIASLLENDYFHHQALRLIGKYSKLGYQIIIPLPVMLEIINVCMREKGKYWNIIMLLKNLLKSYKQNITVLDAAILIETAMHFADKLSLKSQDFTIALYYAILKPEIFESYDKKLLRNIQQIKP